ncbi:effector-associated constant component EACC1 [Streptomyces galilaeus]
MNVNISFSGREGQALIESLSSWLAMEEELRGRVKTDGLTGSGDLGTGMDLLAVAVGSGGAATVLISSIGSWLQQPKKSDVVLKVTMSDGKSVEIDSKRVTIEQAKELLRDVLEASEGGES